MKRVLTLLAVVLCFVQMPTANAVGTSASSAILMDGESGRVLYEENAHEPRLIASITKLMTALVALESGHELDEPVTIRPEWAGVEGSSIYLRAGDRVPLKTLLYGMLLRSGNDAALAVAGSCGGSVEDFVSSMNEKARQLGMENSHFANPNGLNAEGHYSTAYDMALLAKACLENDMLAEIVRTKTVTLGTYTFTNHNKLLWQYDGCIGMKTGYTEKAGRTLVSAAQREGTTLICVTLNDPNDWKDHVALYEEGFSQYRCRQIIEPGQPVGYLTVTGSLLPVCPVIPAEGCSIALEETDQVSISLECSVSSLPAPVRAGTSVGEAVVRLNGEEIKRIDLVTQQSAPWNLVRERGFWHWLQGAK